MPIKPTCSQCDNNMRCEARAEWFQRQKIVLEFLDLAEIRDWQRRITDLLKVFQRLVLSCGQKVVDPKTILLFLGVFQFDRVRIQEICFWFHQLYHDSSKAANIAPHAFLTELFVIDE